MRIVRDSLWNTLHELTSSKKPDWMRVNGSWVDAWVQSGGTPAESRIKALGALVRRRNRDAMIRELSTTIQFLDEMEVAEAA